MITIELFYKLENFIQFLRLTFDSKEELFLVDYLLADRYRIIEQSKNSIILVSEEKGYIE